MFAEPLLAQNATITSTSKALTPSEASVHTSFAKILVKHMRKMQANPKHDPFKSGEVIAAYRIHADALQASGFNAQVTAAVRAGQATPLTSADMDKHFAVLSQLGVKLDNRVKAKMSAMVIRATSSVAPHMPSLMLHNSILKLQRSVHGTMIQMRTGAAPATVISTPMRVKARIHQPLSHFMTAAYHPDSAHLSTVAFDDGGDDGGDDGWGDGDGDGDGSGDGDGPGLLLGPGSGGGDGGGSDGGGDGYDSAYDNLVSSLTDMLDSGTMSCAEYNADVAKISAALATASGALAGIGYTTVIAIGAGVTVTLPELAALFTLFASFAVIMAVIC